MNVKRWLLASLAAFVVFGVLEFVIHGVLLDSLYKQTASVWRPEAEIERMMWLFWLSYLIMAPVFAFIYTQGYEAGKSGLAQGLRYGVYMGILLGVAHSLGWYVVLPIPGTLVVYWVISGWIEVVVAGIAVGLVYRN